MLKYNKIKNIKKYTTLYCIVLNIYHIFVKQYTKQTYKWKKLQ